MVVLASVLASKVNSLCVEIQGAYVSYPVWPSTVLSFTCNRLLVSVQTVGSRCYKDGRDLGMASVPLQVTRYLRVTEKCVFACRRRHRSYRASNQWQGSVLSLSSGASRTNLEPGYRLPATGYPGTGW